MAPVVLAVSLAFSLPVSTPPNALAFASGRLSVRDMAPLGALLNVACCAVVFLFLFTTGEVIFGLGSQPAWAAGIREPPPHAPPPPHNASHNASGG